MTTIGKTEALLRLKDTGLVRARAVGLRRALSVLLLALSLAATVVGLVMSVRVYTMRPSGPIPAADSTSSTAGSRSGSAPAARKTGVTSPTTPSPRPAAPRNSSRSRGSTATAAGAAPPTRPTGWLVNWGEVERWGR